MHLFYQYIDDFFFVGIRPRQARSAAQARDKRVTRKTENKISNYAETSRDETAAASKCSCRKREADKERVSGSDRTES